MRLFKCQHCGEVIYFENRLCVRCGHRLGFVAERTDLCAVESADNGWRTLTQESAEYRFCANAEYDACNWLVPHTSESPFCRCCLHNRTIADLSDAGNLARWQALEVAKHRLFYALLRLQLLPETRNDNPDHGLVFDLIDETSVGDRVLTGHDNGIITIALREANPAERERMRVDMGEPYRTALGHFRHEIGHYYWDRLVRDGGLIAEFRQLFGDESRDYEAALKSYYRVGAAADWQSQFVSEYASSHPWEDFAETWAHYLHIIDTLETAVAYGVRLRPSVADNDGPISEVAFDPYGHVKTQGLIDVWLPLSFAVNSLNRSMGQPDLYPFILSPAAIAKIDFINELVHTSRKRISREEDDTEGVRNCTRTHTLMPS